MKEWLDKYLGQKFRDSVLRKEGITLPVDRRFNCKTREISIEKSADDYVVYFCLPFDNDLVSALELNNRAVPYDGIYFRNDKVKCKEIIEVTYQEISELVNQLTGEEKEQFIRWASEESRKAYEEEKRKELESTLARLPDLKINSLTRDATRKEYLHLLYTFRYDATEKRFCWDAFNHDYTADDFPGKPDYVTNNRAFYVLGKDKYFVVSKNNYDTFWASQGNGFESCFSLTSSHGYIRGVPFWIAHKGFFMCYMTDGDITKWSAIPGHKCKLPKMTARAWGYLRPNGTLCLGKTYDKSGDRGLFWKDKDIARVFGSVKPDGFQVETDYQMSRYAVYYDNLSCGMRVDMSGEGGRGSSELCGQTFYNRLQKLKFNEDIKYWDAVADHDGFLVEKIVLPYSGLEKNPLNEVIESMLSAPASVGVQVECTFDGCSKILTFYGERVGEPKNFSVKINASGIYIKEGDGDERLIAPVQH